MKNYFLKSYTKKNRIFNSITIIFSLILIGLIVISYTIAGITISNYVNNNIKESTLKNTFQIVEQNNNYVELIFDSFENYYYQLQANTDFVRLVTAEYGDLQSHEEALTIGRRYLEAIRKSNNFIESIIYVNSDGLSIAAPFYKFIQIDEDDLYDKDIYEQAWSNESEFLLLPPRKHQIYSPDIKTISLVKSFRESLMLRETGILIITLKPEIIQSFISNGNVENNRVSYVINSEGYVLSHKEKSLLGTSNDYFSNIVKNIEDNEAKRQQLFDDAVKFDNYEEYEKLQVESYKSFSYFDESINEEKLIIYSIIKDSDLYIISEMLAKDINIEASKTVRYIIIIIFVMSIVSIPISIIMTIWITKPIKNIILQMELFENGDRKVRILEQYPHEFSKLKDSFNNMANTIDHDFIEIQTQMNTIKEISKSLETRKTELLDLNDTLEAKVQMRTMELEKSLDDLKETQNRLLASEKQSAIAFLISTIAHELNTPVGTCITSVTYLESETKKIIKALELKNLSKRELNEYLTEGGKISSIIFDELKKVNTVIQGFQDLSIFTGNNNRTEFKVKHHIEEIIEINRTSFEEKHIVLNLICADNIYMNSSPALIYQLFEILIDNIVEHAFNSKLEGIVDIIVIDMNTYIKVNIKDNGAGIAPEYLDKIFNPFYTTHTLESSKGLGLSIVYNIVTIALHGEIKCESVLGEGTTFKIRLPKVTSLRT